MEGLRCVMLAISDDDMLTIVRFGMTCKRMYALAKERLRVISEREQMSALALVRYHQVRAQGPARGRVAKRLRADEDEPQPICISSMRKYGRMTKRGRDLYEQEGAATLSGYNSIYLQNRLSKRQMDIEELLRRDLLEWVMRDWDHDRKAAH